MIKNQKILEHTHGLTFFSNHFYQWGNAYWWLQWKKCKCSNLFNILLPQKPHLKDVFNCPLSFIRLVLLTKNFYKIGTKQSISFAFMYSLIAETTSVLLQSLAETSIRTRAKLFFEARNLSKAPYFMDSRLRFEIIFPQSKLRFASASSLAQH